MMKKKRILAVGGGFASVKLALELAHDENFSVTLMAPHDQIEYHGALYRSATGRSPLEVVMPFREVFDSSPDVNVVNDLMTELRASTKEIKGMSGKTYGYDALVLGIGYEKEYFGTRGAREHTESMYTIYDAIALRSKLLRLFLRRAGGHCDVVIVGAGPTGVELAGDIETFASIVAEQYGVKAARPKVIIVDRCEHVLPMLSPRASAAAEERLKELGIKFIGRHAVDRCTSRHIALKGGRILPADVIVWTAGSRANPFFERYPDIFALDPKKRVVVGEYLQANNPNIYVLGDAASTPFSGMAQTAISDALQLAANFKRYVRGQDLVPYQPQTPLAVVPIGPEWAVVDQVDAKGRKHLLTGKKGWQVRRDADYFVLSNFLPPSLAKKHWERGLQIAQIK